VPARFAGTSTRQWSSLDFHYGILKGSPSALFSTAVAEAVAATGVAA